MNTCMSEEKLNHRETKSLEIARPIFQLRNCPKNCTFDGTKGHTLAGRRTRTVGRGTPLHNDGAYPILGASSCSLKSRTREQIRAVSLGQRKALNVQRSLARASTPLH